MRKGAKIVLRWISREIGSQILAHSHRFSHFHLVSGCLKPQRSAVLLQLSLLSAFAMYIKTLA